LTAYVALLAGLLIVIVGGFLSAACAEVAGVSTNALDERSSTNFFITAFLLMMRSLTGRADNNPLEDSGHLNPKTGDNIANRSTQIVPVPGA
jgi:hypothetical protein